MQVADFGRWPRPAQRSQASWASASADCLASHGGCYAAGDDRSPGLSPGGKGPRPAKLEAGRQYAGTLASSEKEALAPGLTKKTVSSHFVPHDSLSRGRLAIKSQANAGKHRSHHRIFPHCETPGSRTRLEKPSPEAEAVRANALGSGRASHFNRG